MKTYSDKHYQWNSDSLLNEILNLLKAEEKTLEDNQNPKLLTTGTPISNAIASLKFEDKFITMCETPDVIILVLYFRMGAL